MLKKTNILGLLLCISIISLQAQLFYYYQGQKIELTVDRNVVNVMFDENIVRSSNTNQMFQRFGVVQDELSPNQTMTKLNFGRTLTEREYSELTESLKQSEEVKHVFPFFERPGADPIGTSAIFYIQLKEVQDTVLLREVAKRQGVQIVKQIPYMPLWYILSLRGSGFSNSIEATNYFFETGLFAEIDPAFMFNFRPNCTNDPYFDQQWGLRQTTSNTSIGINACSAWTITRGSGINVAVVDQGIDPNLPDLKANLHPLSFDTQSDSDSAVYVAAFDHGMFVAGIIAAVKNNELQITGIAPESKIIGVSNTLYANPYISAELASGISWAWNEAGADIINNSWGDQGGNVYYVFHSTVLESAIDSALVFGRQGKGAIVVFASGNFGGRIVPGRTSTIDYPAFINPAILVVGAVDGYGQRVVNCSVNSGYGMELDIVAPGLNILSFSDRGCEDVIDGTTFYSGTSYAAPHVSGVAALILSVNPNLTGQEVRDIIMSTAQKVRPYPDSDGLYNYQYTHDREHNGSWHWEVGHGLVDAYEAVKAALATLPPPAISGPDKITCEDTPVNFEILNLPPNATVNWTVSSNIFVNNTSGNSISTTVSQGYFPFYCCVGTITATINIPNSNSIVLTKDVKVGFPPLAYFISTVHNLSTQPWDNSGGLYLWSIECPFEDVITYMGHVIRPDLPETESITGGEWRNNIFGCGNDIEVLSTTLELEESHPEFGYFLTNTWAKLLLTSHDPITPTMAVRLQNACGWSNWAPITYIAGATCWYGKANTWSIELYQPTNSELHIEFLELSDTEQLETYTITLTDNFGNLRGQRQFRHRQRDGRANPVRFNTASFLPGVYHLHIEGAGQAMNKQIIIR